MAKKTNRADEKQEPLDGRKNKKVNLLVGAIALVGLVAIIALARFASAYFGTPEHIKYPKLEHAHIRLQILVHNQPVDFSTTTYQHPQGPFAVCSDGMEAEPFHFHDNLDQMLHIHWQDMTGGQLVKYYGWDLSGGDNTSLGYRYDSGVLKPQEVLIHGQNLPDPGSEAQFFIYVGDESSYERKSWSDFLEQDLETFLGKQSRFPAPSQSSWFESPFGLKAYAHGGVDDGHQDNEVDKAQLQLERIQNLLGNIVIFAQNEEPNEAQIQDRFDKLIPLPESSCSG